jgi:thioredoxin 1
VGDSTLIEITDESFQAQVEGAGVPVLVAFTSPDCGVCRTMKPRLELLAAEFEGAVRFGSCDVTANPQAVQRVEVRRLPTIALFERGESTAQLSGLVPVRGVRDLLARVLARGGRD